MCYSKAFFCMLGYIFVEAYFGLYCSKTLSPEVTPSIGASLVSDLGFRISGSGFRVSGLGFGRQLESYSLKPRLSPQHRAWGLGTLRVPGLGFRL